MKKLFVVAIMAVALIATSATVSADNCQAKCHKERTPVRGNPHSGVKGTPPAGSVAIREKEIRSMRSPNI